MMKYILTYSDTKAKAGAVVLLLLLMLFGACEVDRRMTLLENRYDSLINVVDSLEAKFHYCDSITQPLTPNPND